MTIKVGDKVPSATLNIMTEDGPDAITTDDLLAGNTWRLHADVLSQACAGLRG